MELPGTSYLYTLALLGMLAWLRALSIILVPEADSTAAGRAEANPSPSMLCPHLILGMRLSPVPS